MGLIRKSPDDHPIFTSEGCQKVIHELHAVFAREAPEEYEKERVAWWFLQRQIDMLVENPAIFGSTSAFGYLIGAHNSILWNDSISHALFAANNLSVLPVVDSFIWRSGFKDAIEAAILMEWPNVVHVVTQDPETGIVCVHCRHSGGIIGRIKNLALGHPSPDEVLSTLQEFFGDQDFIRYKYAITGNQVRLAVFYNISEESVDETTTAEDPISEFRRELIGLAWKASGNT